MFSALLRSEIDLLRDTQPAESKLSTEEAEVQNKQINSQRMGSGKPNVPETHRLPLYSFSTDLKIWYYPVSLEVPSISKTLVPWRGENRAFLRKRSLGYLHSILISIFASRSSF